MNTIFAKALTLAAVCLVSPVQQRSDSPNRETARSADAVEIRDVYSNYYNAVRSRDYGRMWDGLSSSKRNEQLLGNFYGLGFYPEGDSRGKELAAKHGVEFEFINTVDRIATLRNELATEVDKAAVVGNEEILIEHPIPDLNSIVEFLVLRRLRSPKEFYIDCCKTGDEFLAERGGLGVSSRKPRRGLDCVIVYGDEAIGIDFGDGTQLQLPGNSATAGFSSGEEPSRVTKFVREPDGWRIDRFATVKTASGEITFPDLNGKDCRAIAD